MEEKIEDFEHLFTIISENYPYLDVLKRQEDYDWMSKKEEFVKLVKKTDNDREFFGALHIILSKLNNGHVNMISNESAEWLRKIYYYSYGWQSLNFKTLNHEKAVNRYNLGSLEKEKKK